MRGKKKKRNKREAVKLRCCFAQCGWQKPDGKGAVPGSGEGEMQARQSPEDRREPGGLQGSGEHMQPRAEGCASAECAGTWGEAL